MEPKTSSLWFDRLLFRVAFMILCSVPIVLPWFFVTFIQDIVQAKQPVSGTLEAKMIRFYLEGDRQAMVKEEDFKSYEALLHDARTEEHLYYQFIIDGKVFDVTKEEFEKYPKGTSLTIKKGLTVFQDAIILSSNMPITQEGKETH